MAQQRKYREQTSNRTMTFYTKDLETLIRHSDHRTTVTDMVQEAIKDYLTKRGWTEQDQGQEQEQEAQRPEPGPGKEPSQITNTQEEEDNPLPDYLRKRT